MRTRLRWNWGYIVASLVIGLGIGLMTTWAVDSLPLP